MNILMLNYEFPPIGGGASPVSYDIGKGLVEKGHDVTVVTMGYKGLLSFECVEGMKVYRVKCMRTQKMVCHPWEQATYIISALHFIRHQLDASAFDICYTHFIIPTGPISWCLKQKYDLPYVITAHGSDVIGHNNKRFKSLYHILQKPWCRIVRDAAAVVAPSRYLVDLIYSNEAQVNCRLIPNGIDTGVFQKKGQKQKKIVVMGRLQETKNVQTIIKALTKVDLHEWSVDILGDGPYKQTLQKLVKECQMEERITFRGWVENKSPEHLKLLQESAIYISASRVENCPTSVLEAISCGMNILLSDIPAHRQLVEQIDQSVFFEKDDIDVLADKLQKLIDRLDNVEERNNTYPTAQFDWNYGIEKYNELFVGCKR